MELVRFKATDGLELCGWYSDVEGDAVAIHIHGMSGNGYENLMVDSLRKAYTNSGISFFSVDTRGRGRITDFARNGNSVRAGSCYEIFEESVFDIQGAIDYCLSANKTKVILQGHSLGGSKVVHYVTAQQSDAVAAVVLLAPTDMDGWANAQPDGTELEARARELIAAGKPKELVSLTCWLDDTPLCAETYLSLSEAGTNVDIYGGVKPVLGGIDLPMTIIYGTEDIGIKEIDGSISSWVERVNGFKNVNTSLVVVDGANHGFTSKLGELETAITEFCEQLL